TALAEGEGEAADDALRRAAGEPLRVVHAAPHLAAPQAPQLGLDARLLDAVGPAVTRAAGDQGEDEAGTFRRAAVDARPHRQRAMPAMDLGGALLGHLEFGTPDQRGVAEDPDVAAL